MTRFWRKVAIGPPSECWPWGGTKTEFGHGQYRMGGKVTTAHRAAFVFTNGQIPDGLVVRHLCDNPACCNPNHLTPGTHAENVSDRVARGRSATGERNGRSVLTRELVASIRASDLSDLEIAVRLRVSKETVRNLRNGVGWPGVTAERIIDLSEIKPDRRLERAKR